MSSAESLKYLHILLFVAWLGIDVGVFSASFVVRNRGLSGETRAVLRRMMRGLDLAPRLSLVLMIPIAVTLAHATNTGALGLPDALLWAIGACGVLWAALLVWNFAQADPLGTITRPDRRPLVRAVARVDTGLRVCAAAGFLTTGVWSILSDGPWQVWTVAWKSTIFGLVVLAGLWIRFGGKAFGPALRTVVADGETEDQLRRMDMAMRRVYPAVVGIWVALLVMAGIAVFG